MFFIRFIVLLVILNISFLNAAQELNNYEEYLIENNSKLEVSEKLNAMIEEIAKIRENNSNDNKIMQQIEDKIRIQLSLMEKETNFGKNISSLEGNLNKTLVKLTEIQFKVEENFKKILDNMIENKIIKRLEEMMNQRLDKIESLLEKSFSQTSIELKINNGKNITATFNSTFENQTKKIFEEMLNQHLNNMDKNIISAMKNICDQEKNNNTNRTLNENFDNGYDKSSGLLGCKEEERENFDYKSLYRLDNENLTNVILKKNPNGNITYLEMHLAFKGPRDGLILLSAVPDPGFDDFYYEIVVGGYDNKDTRLRTRTVNKGTRDTNGPTVINKQTNYILCPHHFTAFYVKIDNGTLEFGKEGSYSPLFTHFDAKLSTIKYFGFSSYDGSTVKILYDCYA